MQALGADRSPTYQQRARSKQVFLQGGRWPRGGARHFTPVVRRYRLAYRIRW